MSNVLNHRVRTLYMYFDDFSYYRFHISKRKFALSVDLFKTIWKNKFLQLKTTSSNSYIRTVVVAVYVS